MFRTCLTEFSRWLTKPVFDSHPRQSTFDPFHSGYSTGSIIRTVYYNINAISCGRNLTSTTEPVKKLIHYIKSSTTKTAPPFPAGIYKKCPHRIN